jgi:AbrB family looped-hinge helix DNA binding protein
MVVKLSSKGQLVIPKEIRRALNLEPGATFDVKLVDDQIVLQPLKDAKALQQTIAEMRQLAVGGALTNDLEAEHLRELEKERQREQPLRAG